MEIRQLKQVEEIAKKMFPCIVRSIPDIHVKGARGVKLIVGTKENPAFDAQIATTAATNRENLPIELKINKALLETKINPEAADVRIIWISPGMTDKELINKYLMPIKKSLEVKKPVEYSNPGLTKIEAGESDADLAAKLAKGETVDSRLDEWDDDVDENDPDVPTADMAELDERDNLNQPEPEDPVEDKADRLDEVMDGLQAIANNIKTLDDNIKEMDKRVKKIEKKAKTKK